MREHFGRCGLALGLTSSTRFRACALLNEEGYAALMRRDVPLKQQSIWSTTLSTRPIYTRCIVISGIRWTFRPVHIKERQDPMALRIQHVGTGWLVCWSLDLLRAIEAEICWSCTTTRRGMCSISTTGCKSRARRRRRLSIYAGHRPSRLQRGIERWCSLSLNVSTKRHRSLRTGATFRFFCDDKNVVLVKKWKKFARVPVLFIYDVSPAIRAYNFVECDPWRLYIALLAICRTVGITKTTCVKIWHSPHMNRWLQVSYRGNQRRLDVSTITSSQNESISQCLIYTTILRCS
jgi:hypothetical protein